MQEHDTSRTPPVVGLLNSAVTNVATLLFLSTIVLVTIQVFVRTVLNPLGIDVIILWAEPAARIALILGSFWGAAVVSRNREHIAITFPLKNIRERSTVAYAFCRSAIGVLSVCFSALVTYGMFEKAVSQWDRTFSGLGVVPGGVIYVAVALALALMTAYELRNAVQNVLGEDRLLTKETVYDD